MKAYDYLKNENLFDEINKIETMPFLDGGEALEVNKLFLFKYGGRVLYSKTEMLTVPELAKIIHTMYSKRWVNLILIDETDFDITSGSVRSLTENNNTNSNNVSSNISVNKVSAYDDVALIDDTGSNSDTNSTNTKTGDKVREEKTKSLYSSYMNLSLLQKNNIIDLVFDDVRNLICLSIY